MNTFYQTILKNDQARMKSAESDRRELDASRSSTCNKAARILRRLGFRDAVAEQSDTGGRDVNATFLGHFFTIRIFRSGSVACLPPLSQYHGTKWAPIRQDLSNLPEVVSQSLSAALRHGLKPNE